MPRLSYDIKFKNKKLKRDAQPRKKEILSLFDFDATQSDSKEVDEPNANTLKRARVEDDCGTFKPLRRGRRLYNADDELKNYFKYTGTSVECKLYHSDLPSFNLNSVPLATCLELKPYPSYKLPTPRPVYVASKHLDAFDLCKRRTFFNYSLQSRLVRAANGYKTALKRQRDLRHLEKEHKYYRGLFEFAERLEQNHDPDFYGNYDFYYSGGNLSVLSQDYIAHVDGGKLHDMNVSQIPYVNAKSCPLWSNCCKETFSKSSEIFEVTHMPIPKDTYEICFTARQHKRISICSWHPEQNELRKILEFKSKKSPFISSSYDAAHPDKILISNLKQEVRLYDIHFVPPVQTAVYKHSDDYYLKSWNTIKHWHDDNYIFANDVSLNVLDIRTKPDKWAHQAFLKPKTATECDNITAVAVSNFENFVYVATNHKLHCVDLRKLGSHFESSGAVCCWTHMIEYAPILISTVRVKNKEYIALAGPIASDVRLCELSRCRNLVETELEEKKYLYKSTSLPYQPPTLEEAYNHARLAGKCLDPKSDLKRRLKSCNVGLTFYNYINEQNTKTTFLLTANSVGDVFAQTLVKRAPFENDFAQDERTADKKLNRVMSSYSKEIVKTVPVKLNYTDIVDLSCMRKILRCEKLGNNFKAEPMSESSAEINNTIDHQKETMAETAIDKQRKRQKLGGWQKSLQSLFNYKDALVKDLLFIWDIEFEKERPIHFKDEKLKTKPDPESLVNAWLNKNYAEPPMTSVPASNIQGLSAFEEDVTGFDCTQQSFYFDNLNDALQSTQVSKVLNDTVVSSYNNLQSIVKPARSLNTTTRSLIKGKSKTKRKSKFVKGF